MQAIAAAIAFCGFCALGIFAFEAFKLLLTLIAGLAILWFFFGS